MEKEEFHITDEGSADWLVSKLACIDAEVALLRGQADTAVKRLMSDRDALLNFYGSELETYIRAKVAGDPKGRKSVILPHGTCAFRTVPAAVRVADEDAALRYALDTLPSCTRTMLAREAYLKAVKQTLRDTGEMLPGVEMSEAKESFSIRFGKGAGSDEDE